MKYRFPAPPNFHGDLTGPEVPARLSQIEIQSCDGSGVRLQFQFANGDGTNFQTISMSLPAAMKLSKLLDETVSDYLYNTGEVIE